MTRKLLMAAAVTAVAIFPSVPAFADPAGSSPSGAQSIEPGKVGPGSENNAVVSPTSPSVPINKQPPPDINLPANSGAGSSTGEKGSGPEATTPPHDPSSPGLQ